MNISRLQRMLAVHEDGSKRPHFRTAQLPISWLTILPQPRITFEEEPLQALTDDLADKGLMNPITVANYCSYELAQEHLRLVSEVRRGQVIDPKVLRYITGEGIFILIAGERRTRAHRHWWEHGCTACVELGRQKQPGDCVRFHKSLHREGEPVIDARLILDANPLSTLFQQLSENTHVSVPSHEEARAYADLYRLLRHAQPKLTQKAFARHVGRSARVVAQSLRYAELPDTVQAFTAKGALSYLGAVEMAQLLALMDGAGGRVYDDARLLAVAEYIVSKGFRLPEVKAYIRTLVQTLRQPALLGDVQPSAADIQRAAQRAQMRQAITGLSQVQTCLRRARLVQDLEPERRAARLSRIFRRQLAALQELLAHSLEEADGYERDELRLLKNGLVSALEQMRDELSDTLTERDLEELALVFNQLEHLNKRAASARAA